MNHIVVTLFTPQELNHSSYIQTGLFELEHDSFLKVNVKVSLKKRLGTIKVIDSKIKETKQPHPKTSFYQLIDKNNNKTINFATDLYDASFSFSKYALENCDYVFKRNFEKEMIEKLPLEYQKKIIPFGLTFPSHSKFKKYDLKFFLGLMISNLFIHTKFDRMFFTRLYKCFKEQIHHWKFYRATRLISDFEKNSPFSDDVIFFQTRCFPHEEDTDTQQIHKQRYNIILLLREKFKNNFRGGIIASPLANDKYKEALSDLPSDPISYLKLLKNAKIVIYTRGLVNSPAWKMAEYLSQAKVIIAEKLTAELPEPILDGKEVLFFENESDLVCKIEEALKNEKLCLELSKNARNYFDRNVHPKQNVKRIINYMLAQNK